MDLWTLVPAQELYHSIYILHPISSSAFLISFISKQPQLQHTPNQQKCVGLLRGAEGGMEVERHSHYYEYFRVCWGLLRRPARCEWQMKTSRVNYVENMLTVAARTDINGSSDPSSKPPSHRKSKYQFQLPACWSCARSTQPADIKWRLNTETCKQNTKQKTRGEYARTQQPPNNKGDDN